MKLPLTAEPDLLTSRYVAFWHWFSRHERQFFQVMKEYTHIEEGFFELLSPALDTIKSGFYFQTGMFDEYTVELQISADGIIEQIVFVEELIQTAPTIPGWMFTALKSATDIEHTTITMADYEFSTDTLSFYADDDAAHPDNIDIVVMHRNYAEENGAVIRNGTLIFLDNYLGELDFATTIDRITVTGETVAPHERVPIEKLRDFLVWRQKEFVEKYEGLRHRTADDTNAILSAESTNGNKLVAVVNTDLLAWDSKASHPWVMVVAVAYDGTDRGGMPDQTTYALLDELEDAIVAKLPDSEGYLNIGRETANSNREIYFACQDFRKPAKVLYQFQTNYAGKLDVTYEIYKDKYWQSFERFEVV